MAQSHLHCTHPSLLLPYHSSYTDICSGLQAFGHAVTIVQSGLHSSSHLVGLNAVSSGKPSLPSLFWMRAPPVLALGRHLAYFIALFHTLSSLPLYLPAYLSKMWAPWRHVLCVFTNDVNKNLSSTHYCQVLFHELGIGLWTKKTNKTSAFMPLTF